MPCNCYIPTPVKNLIQLAKNTGANQNEIAKRYNVNRSTVSRIWKRAKEGIELSRRPKSGRPRKITKSGERFLVKDVKINPFQTSTCVMNRSATMLGITISRKTAQRILKSHGLHGRRPARKPLLKKRHRIARLAFARKYCNWSIEQ